MNRKHVNNCFEWSPGRTCAANAGKPPAVRATLALPTHNMGRGLAYSPWPAVRRNDCCSKFVCGSKRQSFEKNQLGLGQMFFNSLRGVSKRMKPISSRAVLERVF
jgi:hypothetical protein